MEGLTNGEILANVALLVGWITFVAVIARDKKDDSETMRITKRIARHTLTGTLLICVGLAALGLYLTKVHQ